MKSFHSATVNRRRKLAEVLRSLRTIRKSATSRQEFLERVAALQCDAGVVFQFLKISYTGGSGPEAAHFRFRVDKGLLRAAELADRGLRSLAESSTPTLAR
jgi:hypothetical protein